MLGLLPAIVSVTTLAARLLRTSTAFPWNDSYDDLSKLGSMTHELTPTIGAV
jgi:hypothetical protein